MNNKLTLKLPVEVIDYVFNGEVSSQVREKTLIAWLGVRRRLFISDKGDILTQELRKVLGTEWRTYINLASETQINPFDTFRRWGFIECQSASVLKRFSLFKDLLSEE
jgi:hypothetical protein